MGVAEEAIITSVVEYGWRSLVVPWLEHRESPQVQSNCARLTETLVKLSFTSPSLCSDFKGNSDVSEPIRAHNRVHRSRPTLEYGQSSSSAPRTYAADQKSGKKIIKLKIMGSHR